jgi:signal peptidase I
MFTPGHVKHARLLVRHAEKLLRYRKDLLSDNVVSDLKTQIRKVRKILSGRDKTALKAESDQLHALYMLHMPAPKDAAWRENVEVILVAIVVAIGIRSYFLQPFKIPTGSMQPTLNGIIGHKHFYQNEAEIPADQKMFYEHRDNGWYLGGYSSKESGPNMLRQIAEFVVLGRNYINVVSAEDDQVTQVLPKKFAFFFTFSRIVCERQNFLVYAPPDTLRQDFKVLPGSHYGRGETIAKGAIDTGDQVFVDKFSYNFVKPHRGDVFVFRTDNIFGIPGDPETGAPFFIKRLGGVPGDTLRIQSPLFYVNDKIAEGFGFGRVMAAKDAYRGYAPGRDYLSDPTRTYKVPERHFFAMGDNSYNSYDSRWWGPVPEENLVGRGLLVYWPFNRHWGLIR